MKSFLLLQDIFLLKDGFSISEIRQMDSDVDFYSPVVLHIPDIFRYFHHDISMNQMQYQTE